VACDVTMVQEANPKVESDLLPLINLFHMCAFYVYNYDMFDENET
jgi:hypothetical protein